MSAPGKLLDLYGDPMDKPAFEKAWMVVYKFPEWLASRFPTSALNGRPVTRIYMHKKLVPLFELTMLHLVEAGLISELKTFDGCWNVRYQRGSTKQLSIHSWGLAIDFNAKDNPLGGEVKFSQAFLDVWRKTETHGMGWVLGADFKPPRVDGMHFEATKFL